MRAAQQLLICVLICSFGCSFTMSSVRFTAKKCYILDTYAAWSDCVERSVKKKGSREDIKALVPYIRRVRTAVLQGRLDPNEAGKLVFAAINQRYSAEKAQNDRVAAGVVIGITAAVIVGAAAAAAANRSGGSSTYAASAPTRRCWEFNPTPCYGRSSDGEVVCYVGKACGNTCIASGYTCYMGPGCACNY